MMPDERTRILFLCIGNSARSILAEAIANELFGDELFAFSAGSEPKKEPHPLAIATLRAHGLPVDRCTSKPISAVQHESFDLVITLCDAAQRACPTFPGAAAQTHWGIPDPPSADDPEEMFERVFNVLTDAIGALVSPPRYDLAAKAQIVARQVRLRLPQSAAT